jgi:hypothetical protein
MVQSKIQPRPTLSSAPFIFLCSPPINLPLSIPITSSAPCDTIQILRDNPRFNRILITPPIIIQLTLPSPENPAQSMVLVSHDLCLEPLFVEGGLTGRRPCGCVFDVVWWGEGELSDDGGSARAGDGVVCAGGFEIGGLGDGYGAVPFEVAMLVVWESVSLEAYG